MAARFVYGHSPVEPPFPSGDHLTETVDWYLNNRQWIDYVRRGEYRSWIE